MLIAGDPTCSFWNRTKDEADRLGDKAEAKYNRWGDRINESVEDTKRAVQVRPLHAARRPNMRPANEPCTLPLQTLLKRCCLATTPDSPATTLNLMPLLLVGQVLV